MVSKEGLLGFAVRLENGKIAHIVLDAEIFVDGIDDLSGELSTSDLKSNGVVFNPMPLSNGSEVHANFVARVHDERSK